MLYHSRARSAFDVVVVAASMGGREALRELLRVLPRECPFAMVVAQHLPRAGPSVLARLLQRETVLPVKWAEHVEPLRAGVVYVAPPASQCSISALHCIRLRPEPAYSGPQPAADILFHSAAQHVGSRTIGIVLSGRLSDGANGSVGIAQRGGIVIAQHPDTCAAKGMPTATIATGAATFILPPAAIGAALVAFTMVPGGAELFGRCGTAA